MLSTSLRNADRRKRIERLESLANALDSRFRLFGVSFGWDALLGLIPGVGAVATIAPGGVLIAEGARMGARKRVLLRMALNTGLDLVVGALPVLGDIFDIYFKSHQRSLALLKVELLQAEIAEDARKTALEGVYI